MNMMVVIVLMMILDNDDDEDGGYEWLARKGGGGHWQGWEGNEGEMIGGPGPGSREEVAKMDC